ncbi:MAG: succinylglutamate desuccinylase/aspartoacylase family protein [Cyclobacteriaceae bacterium]|nr:succinylglutamate desuccinylase/aspartoacylase family protein [Cyclobacteriaceae bacterium]
MDKVDSEGIEINRHADRIIGCIKGQQSGPTIVFFGGIHGNEPAGVSALHQVVQEWQNKEAFIKGTIYAISGNLWALERGERYHKQDLNRLWTTDRLKKLKNGTLETENKDIEQMADIYNTIWQIINTENGPFYFMDLHTTSSRTIPFLTVNDSLLNRKFVVQYPAPIILGLEEYLDGPLLSYINELGYVSFGFESGHHTQPESIDYHVAFIYLSLYFTGCINKDKVDIDRYYNILNSQTVESRDIFEIYYKHTIKKDDAFEMKAGFDNFQLVAKNQTIATSNGKTLRAKKKGRIFMPLYQNQGDDGFFAIRRIRSVYLHLSSVLRRIHFDRILHFLPGVRWASDTHDTLLVNRTIARFFTKKIFHLMGYRSRKLDKHHFIMKNREAASKTEAYKKAAWYNK